MKSNLEKLPEFCLSILETNPPGKYVIGIYKGEDCYRSTAYDTHDLAKAKELANHINKKLGVTAAQRECMEAGSMFGWNVPGAQLDYVEALHKKTSRKEIILTDSDWAERFKPLMNPYGEKQGSFSGWDEENPEQGCLFNSAGKDLAYIQDIMAGKVDGLSADAAQTSADSYDSSLVAKICPLSNTTTQCHRLFGAILRLISNFAGIYSSLSCYRYSTFMLLDTPQQHFPSAFLPPSFYCLMRSLTALLGILYRVKTVKPLVPFGRLALTLNELPPVIGMTILMALSLNTQNGAFKSLLLQEIQRLGR